MDLVCEHLNLLEKDYYGLTFADADTQKVSERCAPPTPTPNPSGGYGASANCSHNDLYSPRWLAAPALSAWNVH